MHAVVVRPRLRHSRVAEETIYSCPTTGCASPRLVAKEPTAVSIHGLAVDATNAYWTLDHAVHACPLGGCASPIDVIDLTTIAAGVAVDATNLYWATTPAALVECPLGALDGGETQLASSFGAYEAVALDETNVYWTDPGGGRVLECPIAGCDGKPKLLASGQASPYGIAIDATSVYWVNIQGSTVMRASK